MEKYSLRCMLCSKEWSHNGHYMDACPSCKGALAPKYKKKFEKLLATYIENCYLPTLPLLQPITFNSTFPLELIDADLVYDPMSDEHIVIPQSTTVAYTREYRQPSGSMKDREAGATLATLADFGISEAHVFSTGNAAIAFRRAAELLKRVQIHLHVDAETYRRCFWNAEKREFSDFWIAELTKSTPEIESFNDSLISSEVDKPKNNEVNATGFGSWARREGLKTLGYELYEQLGGPIDYFVQGAGNCLTFFALDIVAEELGYPKPAWVLCQPANCAPLVVKYGRDDASHVRVDPAFSSRPWNPILKQANSSHLFPYLDKKISNNPDSPIRAYAISADEIAASAINNLHLGNPRTRVYPGLEAATASAGLARLIHDVGLERIEGKTIVVNHSGTMRRNDLLASWVIG